MIKGFLEHDSGDVMMIEPRIPRPLPRELDLLRTPESSLDLVAASDAHLSLQVTDVALEHAQVHVQIEPHQEQKLQLQPVDFLRPQSPDSREVGVSVIPVPRKRESRIRHSVP